MAVNVTIRGSQESQEYKDAVKLKNKFENYFTENHHGEIFIIPSATLFGQEITDIDLVVLGKLEKHIVSNMHTKVFDINNKVLTTSKDYYNVFLNNFCFVVEIKGHTAEHIIKEGQTLYVKYGGKKKNVTEQSEKQKYSLKNYLEEHTGNSPHISNFIWFNNASKESLDNLTSDEPANNYLGGDFHIPELFEKLFLQKAPRCRISNQSSQFKPTASFDSFYGRNDEIDLQSMTKVFDLFTKNKEGMGTLTREKLERYSRRLFNDQNYAKDLGEKLIVFAGKAGTGKTSKLLNAAFDLALHHDYRCLILTYNHALVSDIKRIIALQGISSDIDGSTVQISTLHKFFKDILEGFNIGQTLLENGKTELDNFLNDNIYFKLLDELVELIDEGLIDEDEIQNLMKNNYDAIDFDFVLVDESQDWDEREKLVLYKIFSSKKILLAEGSDQLVRTSKKCNWTYQMRPRRDFNKTNENKSLRQKKSLVRFVNSYAEKVGLNWELEPKEELMGGRIIIKVGDYDNVINSSLLKDLYQHKNAAYDMLFFTPPSGVTKDRNERGYVYSSFSKIEHYKQIGANLWDGTGYQFRSKSQYPVDPNQHRIFQYDSCRGLEGWTVVCLEFDEFIRYKMETFQEEKIESGMGELALETFEEKRNRHVYLWSLIPLTRPIDTLVITLKYPNSGIYKILKDVYEENKDIVTWLE